MRSTDADWSDRPPEARRRRAAWRAGGYAADQLIGRGSSGEVWSGRVIRTGEPVALKRISGGAGNWRAAAAREAALLSALDHPNLVRLHALTVAGDDAVVLVLDLAAGGSLAELLIRRGRLTAGEVVTTLAPIASALAYAHDEGVTHSDVSAANVLFSTAGRPLLADLGTARLVGDGEVPRATLGYLDPIVAAGGVPTPATDVFALAGVAMHALSGSAPWLPQELSAAPVTAAEVTARAVAGVIPRLEERLAAAPDAVAAVLRRALSPDPHQRGSATDFALDLRHATPPVPVELAAGRLVRPSAPTRPRRPPDPAVHVPRHAVRRAGGPPPVSPARSRPMERPDFARPHPGSAPDPGAIALTHAVRSLPRPSVPPAGRLARLRWRVSAGRSVVALTARRWALIGVAVLCVSAATVGWRWRVADDPGAGRAGAAMRTGAAAPASAPTPAGSSSPVGAATAGWGAVLTELDARRAQAFAEGDPTKLAEVYPPGPLLEQDSATLRTAAPAGCHISGLHTTYSAVHVVARMGATTLLTVTATLSAAVIVCGGAVVSATSARGPTGLQIGLVTLGSQFRIGTMRVLG